MAAFMVGGTGGVEPSASSAGQAIEIGSALTSLLVLNRAAPVLVVDPTRVRAAGFGRLVWPSLQQLFVTIAARQIVNSPSSLRCDDGLHGPTLWGNGETALSRYESDRR
jgi:hypothetical protein